MHLRNTAEWEATMTREEKLAYVGRRAYELAQTGKHEDFAAIQLAIMREGHAESVPWLERPGIIDAINQICIISRIGDQPCAYA
jgi:hypothetical protein